LRLKYAGNADTRELLDIVGMSRPITFGGIDYDDGATDTIIKRRISPESALAKCLNDRLSESPTHVEARIIRECELCRPMRLALAELIGDLGKRLPAKSLFAITGDLGWLLSDVRGGREFLEIATDGRKPDCANVADLLGLMFAKIPTSGECKSPSFDRPVYPAMDSNIAKQMATNVRPVDVRGYVEAIVTREQYILAHMVAVEEYYIAVAHGIQLFRQALDGIKVEK
jgi:hypothetical protein